MSYYRYIDTVREDIDIVVKKISIWHRYWYLQISPSLVGGDTSPKIKFSPDITWRKISVCTLASSIFLSEITSGCRDWGFQNFHCGFLPSSFSISSMSPSESLNVSKSFKKSLEGFSNLISDADYFPIHRINFIFWSSSKILWRIIF